MRANAAHGGAGEGAGAADREASDGGPPRDARARGDGGRQEADSQARGNQALLAERWCSVVVLEACHCHVVQHELAKGKGVPASQAVPQSGRPLSVIAVCVHARLHCL